MTVTKVIILHSKCALSLFCSSFSQYWNRERVVLYSSVLFHVLYFFIYPLGSRPWEGREGSSAWLTWSRFLPCFLLVFITVLAHCLWSRVCCESPSGPAGKRLRPRQIFLSTDDPLERNFIFFLSSVGNINCLPLVHTSWLPVQLEASNLRQIEMGRIHLYWSRTGESMDNSFPMSA